MMIYMYFLLYLQEEFVEQSTASITWFIIMTLVCDLGVIFEPFQSQDLISNSPYHLLYNSYDVSSENLVLDQLIIP